MKLAVITCHNQPNYIRAVTLRVAFQALPDSDVIVVKNRHKGVIRYPEMIFRLIVLRIRHRPDTYVITFRGYEILPFACLLTWPKTLIFDEMVNPLGWLNEPRPEPWAKLIPKRLLRTFYRLLLKRCSVVLTDTDAHSIYDATMFGLDQKRFQAIPVGTDEALFKPTTRHPGKLFRVFYYGNMLPLHGLDVVLESAINVKELPIEFVLVGGSKKIAELVRLAKQAGANIMYRKWIYFNKLPAEISQADLCLGGPFGNTTQAQHVITGKTYQFLACAAPVVVGENKATKLFQDRRNCLLVALGNSTELTNAIIWAYSHPKELAKIGQAGRKLYEQHFSEDSIARQVAAILRSVHP